MAEMTSECAATGGTDTHIAPLRPMRGMQAISNDDL